MMELENELQIKNITDKLKELSCPLVNNGTDTWLCNVLLKPGIERYNLIEWILKKLEMNIEEYEKFKSLEEKTQSLLEICSGFGFCSEKDSDIIEGTASMHKQVTFWNLLCNSQHEINSLSNSNFQSENSDISGHEKYKPKQYDYYFSYVSKVCESINLGHIFKSELQLFPTYLSKEIKSAIQKSGDVSLSADIIRKIHSDRRGLKNTNSSCDSGISFGNRSLELNEIEIEGIPHEETVMELEANISCSLCNLQNLQADLFNKAHDSLRLYFPKVVSDDFTDIGPSFKCLNEKLDYFLMLKNSATSLSFKDSELNNLNFEISGLESPPEILTDSKLGEFIQVLSDTKKTND